MPPFTLTDDQIDEAVLKFIRDGGSGIGECLRALFPQPVWNNLDQAASIAAYEAWHAVAHWVSGTPYGTCVESRITRSFIRLTQANKIREHITGMGYSTYSYRKAV